MLEIGALVDGKYKILNKVGQGGMSVVYLAMNEKANKQWAVKEVRKDGIKDFEVVKQGLVAETNILKKLSHPNLPSIIDVIDNEDSFIIIMDYIQGNSLNKALEEYGAQLQEDVIGWAKQLCDVLDYLHTREPAIIYRDMKPANVMLKPDGNVMLIDFGTAREFKEKNLADTTCLGTVGYAAPEQFGGMGQTDARTDIYCLGATLYHLVTGKNPCEPPYEIKPIREINPTLSSGLEKIILKCTQRDPNDRYQSAAELMYALEHYEEIDDVYKKKQKKKLIKFFSCVFLTVAFSVTSLWGYIMSQKKKSENYDDILLNASSVEDYLNAIVLEPTKTDAYLGNADKGVKGLVDFMADSDNYLSESENEVFKKIRLGLEQTDFWNYSHTVKVLDELKDSDEKGYKDVCYKIGETCFFFYNNEKGDIDARHKYEIAKFWFKESMSEYPKAKIYYDVSECYDGIYRYKGAKQYENLTNEYKKLYNTIQSLLNDVSVQDADFKLRTCKEVARMVSGDVVDFCSSVGIESIEELVKTIESEVKLIEEEALIGGGIHEGKQNDIDFITRLTDETYKKIQEIKNHNDN